MDKSEAKKSSLNLGGGGLFCHKNQSHLKLPEMDKSEVKKFSFILGGGALFCHKNQSCSKLPEMDQSEVKKISLILGGGFSATKTKVAPNCLKWINLKSKNFPPSWGGRLFCHKNQSCSKLPEMDKSEVKKFSLILGGGFLPQETKVTRNCLKWINLKSKNFPLILGGRGGFSATKTKVALNCLKWINLKSKNFPSSWGEAFLPQKPKLLEIAWNG